MGRITVRRPVLRITETGAQRRPDSLAAEEPLELRLDSAALTVTMRTPGHDVELAHGLLLSEGIITAPADLISARYCDSPGPDGRNTYNVLDIALADTATPSGPSTQRTFLSTSACGVCGKTSLDSVRQRTRFSPADDPCSLSAELLTDLPDRLREAQRVFDSTGGLHAAALFTTSGELRIAREDVGRHNAVDKVLGWALLADLLPLSGHVLMVSGRASFELVQKAAMAGVPVLAAVSAPSSLAADLAEEQGITLVGFLRGTTMNVYTGGHRIRLTTQDDD